MIDIDDAQLDEITGGRSLGPWPLEPDYYKKGWFGQEKTAKGQVYMREVSPSLRPGKWQPVDTFFVLPHD